VLAKGKDNAAAENAEIAQVIPSAKSAHEDIPEPARAFLQQAFETLHAPDAAAVMAGSAVDGMLKALGYTDGSLYSRIDKAVEGHQLTKSMGEWAHEVRLGSNRPRHADKDNPHVSPDEAKQSVEFAEALGHSFLSCQNEWNEALRTPRNRPRRTRPSYRGRRRPFRGLDKAATPPTATASTTSRPLRREPAHAPARTRPSSVR